MVNLKGAFTAQITPFNVSDEVDEEGLRFLINRQLENGVNGIVFLGTTAEAPTLTKNEQLRILTIAREECSGRTIMIAGTGTYSTQTTIENTLQAEQFGADAALIITPYYNRPTQEGIYLHFKAIAEATSLPIILYNNPVRTGVNISIDTLKRLMEIPTIRGIKECSGNITQISNIIEAAKDNRPEFSVLTGDDVDILALMALGGHGVISTVGNLLPKEVVNLVQFLANGDLESAQEMHFKLMPLLRALSAETNPTPIKAAMNFCGLPAGECRLPLAKLSADNAAKIEVLLVDKNKALYIRQSELAMARHNTQIG